MIEFIYLFTLEEQCGPEEFRDKLINFECDTIKHIFSSKIVQMIVIIPVKILKSMYW